MLSKPATEQGLSRTALVALACVLGGASAARAQITPGHQEEIELQRSSVALGSGARALGMGGAFLARADDATAASWNPAGLSYLRRPEVSLVGFHTMTRSEGINAANETSSIDRFEGTTPDFVSVAYPLEIGSRAGSVQVSYQRVLALDGERHLEIAEPRATRVFDIERDGGFDVLALGTGLQLSRHFRVGATLNRWLNGFEQGTARHRRLVARTELQTLQSAEFRLAGWNVNVGAIWSPIEALNVGVVGKSPFTADVTLTRARTDHFLATQTLAVITGNSFESDTVRLEFPWALGFGVSVRPRSAVTLSADYTRTAWSEARVRNYFLLERTPFGQLPPTPEQTGTVFPELPYPTLDMTVPQANTDQVRLGVEWVFIRRKVKIPLRTGYFNDRQYFRDATGSAPRLNGFTVGTGIVTGPFLLDVAYVNERGEHLGESGDRVHVRSSRVWLSLIYRHGSAN